MLYLPGHFLGGALIRKGDGWAESVLLRVACAAAVSTPVLVALALIGRFETPVVLVVLGACAAIARLLPVRGRFRARCGRWDLLSLGAVVGCFAFYVHPAEYVINDWDQ